MPEPVAALHRLAVPFLKELDAVVFDGGLGTKHLPDINVAAPATPSNSKRKKASSDKDIIWGMGTRGDYNDDNGSFIELLWSNRMATTGKRFCFHRVTY